MIKIEEIQEGHTYLMSDGTKRLVGSVGTELLRYRHPESGRYCGIQVKDFARLAVADITP